MAWQVGLKQYGPTDKDLNDLMRKTSRNTGSVVYNDVDPQTKSYNVILDMISASDLMMKSTMVWQA